MVSCGFWSGSRGNNIGLDAARKTKGLLADTSSIPQESVKWISVCQQELPPYPPFLWRMRHLVPSTTVHAQSQCWSTSSWSRPNRSSLQNPLPYSAATAFSVWPMRFFLLLLFSLLQREVALAFDSLLLSSLPQRYCHGCFRFSQRPLTILYLISIVKTFLPPVDRSVLSASLSLLRPPGFSTSCKKGHSKEMTEIALLWMARRLLL